jgi:hypothetical protein
VAAPSAPGNPTLTDITEWPNVLKWLEVENWDWGRQCAQKQRFFDENKFNNMAFMNGWFERLVSLMDFFRGRHGS